MGMFDTLHAGCPRCGCRISAQTKLAAMPCMDNFEIGGMLDKRFIRAEIDDGDLCGHCGQRFVIRIERGRFAGFCEIEGQS